MSLLTAMKGLPLAYNKDMQEDKEPVFDAVDTVEMCLPVFAAMLDTMTVRTDNMRKAAGHGFINATDCADYLTKKGMPFRDAYTVTGHLDADFLGEMDEEQLDKLADDMGVDTTGKDKAEVVAAVAEEPVEVPDISKMKLDELKEFAEDNGIDLTGCTTKASILQKIREYEADAAAAAAIIAPEG
jgi:argininosuccinate lyase